MRKDSAGAKLGLAFGFLIAILIGVGWLGLTRMKQINADVDQILNQSLAKLEIANQTMSYVNTNYRMTMELVLMDHKNPSDVEWYPPRRQENREKIESAEKKLAELAASKREKELVSNIEAAGKPSGESVSKIVDLLKTPGRENQARELMTKETSPLLNQFREAWLR